MIEEGRERERDGERQFMPGVHEIMCLVMVHSYSLKDKFWELENVAQTLFTAHIEFLSSKHTLVSSFLRQSRTSEKLRLCAVTLLLLLSINILDKSLMMCLLL